MREEAQDVPGRQTDREHEAWSRKAPESHGKEGGESLGPTLFRLILWGKSKRERKKKKQA